MEDEYKEIVQKIHLEKDCVYIIFSFKKKILQTFVISRLVHNLYGTLYSFDCTC